MRAPLTIAAAQPATVAYDVAANAAAHAAVVSAAGARVVVFPELSLTGYELDAPHVDLADARLAPLVEACARTGAIALAGAPVLTGGRRYITTVVVDGDGATAAYRKINLHPPEDEHFAYGDTAAALEIDGWRLGLAICKDTRIPEHHRETVALGVDAYVGSVIFTGDEHDVRDDRMRGIAERYGVWVAAACATGATGPFPATSGGSGVWAPGGERVAQAGADAGAFAWARLAE